MKRQYKLVRNYESLGEYLRKKRVDAGMTQREISLDLGYSSSQFISNSERGIGHLPIKKLKRVMKLCKLNQGTVTRLLLEGDEKKYLSALNN